MSRNDPPEASPIPRDPVDPVFRSSLREALVVVGAWGVCGVYTIAFCWFAGYDRPPEEVTFHGGVPDWVLFGIFLPWVLVNIFVAWFALRFVRDEDLEPPSAESTASRTGPPRTEPPSTESTASRAGPAAP